MDFNFEDLGVSVLLGFPPRPRCDMEQGNIALEQSTQIGKDARFWRNIVEKECRTETFGWHPSGTCRIRTGLVAFHWRPLAGSIVIPVRDSKKRKLIRSLSHRVITGVKHKADPDKSDEAQLVRLVNAVDGRTCRLSVQARLAPVC